MIRNYFFIHCAFTKRFLFLFFIMNVLGWSVMAQSPMFIIRGIVTEQANEVPVSFANVCIKNINPQICTITDSSGFFILKNVPVGRYDIEITALGYEKMVVKEIVVSSGKESYLSIALTEKAFALNEVEVKQKISKEQPLNKMAMVSAKMLSVEEASRYAGGFDDPARLVSSFAGVASNVGNNGIVVRGNNPKSLQWKMEGIEIPNPNHFADVTGTFGGGGMTALSSQLLANSDFFTGAFPAEYGNALSGVFDIFMRNGNNSKNENTFQIGVIGIDASSEGPFCKGSRSSYLFNYRYSTLALMAPVLPENAGGVRYQDLSFKLNFPTQKAGTFSWWGIGLIDRSGEDYKEDSTQWYYASDRENQDIKQFMGASGLSHKYYITDKLFIKSTLAATVSGLNYKVDSLISSKQLLPLNRIKNQNWNFVFSSYLNTKFSAKHTNKTGVLFTGLKYNMKTRKALVADADELYPVVDENGFSALLSAYSSSSIKVSDRFSCVLGVNYQMFTLNKHYSVEPRAGLSYQLNNKQVFSFAYGLHSRLERLNYYFTQNEKYGDSFINKELDFSKAHHIVLGYDLNFAEHYHLKVETYFQYLFNIPVIKDSSYSFINLQNDWFFNEKLQNTGLGRNYGIDMTFEKYMTDGLYYMFTASVFDSRYKGGDDIWRNTRFNRNYLFNVLLGKEWKTGKNKQNQFSANVRFTFQGADRYSPVNSEASMASKSVVFDESKAFSKQLDPSFFTHLTLSYRINKQKVSHEFALKVINLTMQKEYEGFDYNYINKTVDMQKEATFIPNISYRIDF